MGRLHENKVFRPAALPQTLALSMRASGAGENDRGTERRGDRSEALQSDFSFGNVPIFGAESTAPEGWSLPAGIRSRFERSLGVDLGSVRVHCDASASAAASALSARAFADGNDIFFGSGEYRPDTAEGECLLAHEVIHTRQQAASPAAALQPKLSLSQPSDAAEREADALAAPLVVGEPISVEARAPAGGDTYRIHRTPTSASPHSAGNASGRDAASNLEFGQRLAHVTEQSSPEELYDLLQQYLTRFGTEDPSFTIHIDIYDQKNKKIVKDGKQVQKLAQYVRSGPDGYSILRINDAGSAVDTDGRDNVRYNELDRFARQNDDLLSIFGFPATRLPAERSSKAYARLAEQYRRAHAQDEVPRYFDAYSQSTVAGYQVREKSGKKIGVSGFRFPYSSVPLGQAATLFPSTSLVAIRDKATGHVQFTLRIDSGGQNFGEFSDATKRGLGNHGGKVSYLGIPSIRVPSGTIPASRESPEGINQYLKTYVVEYLNKLGSQIIARAALPPLRP